jgi:hypothetical protein
MRRSNGRGLETGAFAYRASPRPYSGDARSWNNLALSSVIFAILAIGLVGVLLDVALGRVAKLVAYSE